MTSNNNKNNCLSITNSNNISSNNNNQKARPQSTDGVRKRVGKACDRCRLKKSKCDGLLPCQRCLSDDQICVFSERRRSKDKTYPKGYVELLESRTQALADAIYRLLYCQQNGVDLSNILPPRGKIVINDVLASLDVLKHIPDHPENETYADDLLHKFIADQRARQDSIASDKSGTLSSAASCDSLGSPLITPGKTSPYISTNDFSPTLESAKLPAFFNHIPSPGQCISPSFPMNEVAFSQPGLPLELDHAEISNDQLLADLAWY